VTLLGTFGVDADAEAVYRAALRNPRLKLRGLATLLDRGVAEVRASCVQLHAAGLAHLVGPTLQVVPPTEALSALIRAEAHRLDDERARLEAISAGIAGFEADRLAGHAQELAEDGVVLQAGRQATAAIEDVVRSTTGDVIACQPVLDLGVDSGPYVDVLRHQLSKGRRMRALYPAEVVDDPARLDYVRFWDAAGEEIRLTAQRLPLAAVFGDQVAVLGTEWVGIDGSRVLVRSRPVVALTRAYLELVWARARPFAGAGAGEPVDGTARIVELLALGAKDETIARHLGVSLRTARRRIAELMDELGATTRFQAGLEAGRRGLG